MARSLSHQKRESALYRAKYESFFIQLCITLTTPVYDLEEMKTTLALFRVTLKAKGVGSFHNLFTYGDLHVNNIMVFFSPSSNVNDIRQKPKCMVWWELL